MCSIAESDKRQLRQQQTLTLANDDQYNDTEVKNHIITFFKKSQRMLRFLQQLTKCGVFRTRLREYDRSPAAAKVWGTFSIRPSNRKRWNPDVWKSLFPKPSCSSARLGKPPNISTCGTSHGPFNLVTHSNSCEGSSGSELHFLIGETEVDRPVRFHRS